MARDAQGKTLALKLAIGYRKVNAVSFCAFCVEHGAMLGTPSWDVDQACNSARVHESTAFDGCMTAALLLLAHVTSLSGECAMLETCFQSAWMQVRSAFAFLTQTLGGQVRSSLAQGVEDLPPGLLLGGTDGLGVLEQTCFVQRPCVQVRRPETMAICRLPVPARTP